MVRAGEVVARSRPQQHYFDCPLQLGCHPTYVDATDTARDADVTEVALQDGDIIVCATDGVWDNCFESDVVQLVSQQCRGPQDAGRAAASLAQLAQAHSFDTEYESPYSQQAIEAGFDLGWWDKMVTGSWKDGQFVMGKRKGGKLDDISECMQSGRLALPWPARNRHESLAVQPSWLPGSAPRPGLLPGPPPPSPLLRRARRRGSGSITGGGSTALTEAPGPR